MVSRLTKLTLIHYGFGIISLLFASLSLATPPFQLKIATLAPDGSAWMQELKRWGDDLKEKSERRLELKFYSGGVSGDEPDVIRKMRFGQLHGAILTGHGIGMIHSPTRILEMPFLFPSAKEFDLARTELTPEFKAGFKHKGFELLGLFEVGDVHFFSHQPIRSIAEMRQRRIWIWQGDQLAEVFFQVSNLFPVPLPITEVYSGLSTGLIDTVYGPPLGAIAMQWHTNTSFMSDQAMATGLAAVVIDARFMSRLPADLQQLLFESGTEVNQRLIEVTRRDNGTSREVLNKQGLTTTVWSQEDAKQIPDILRRASIQLSQRRYIPLTLFNRVEQLITESQKSE